MAEFRPDPALMRSLRQRFVEVGRPDPQAPPPPVDGTVVRSAFLYEVVRELYDAAKFGPGYIGQAELESIGKVSDAALEHQMRMLHATESTPAD